LLRLYRICRNIYEPNDATGASRTPGRRHVLGQKVLYYCSSLAMCVLELRANSVSFAAIRREYHYVDIEFDTKRFEVMEVPESFYSKNWTLNRKLTQKYGSEWFKTGKYSILKVYGAVLPTDSNFILNVAHPDFLKLKFPKPMKIPLDSRIN